MSNNELFTITKQYHEKKGVDIWVVRLEVKVDDDTFAELREFARGLHRGYYSTFFGVNGFVFKTEKDAKKFGDKLGDYLQIEESGDNYELELPEFEDFEVEKPKSFRVGKSESSQEANEIEEISLDDFCAALRLLTEENGAKILSDKSFISKAIEIINDFDGFKDLPPSIEFILRTVIMKKYGQRLLTVKDWSDKSSQLVTDFVHNTGFKEDLSEAVFECLAYAVGKVSQVNTKLIKTPILQKQHSPNNVDVNVNVYNIKDFYHCTFLKREKLYCVIFEADKFSGDPTFAIFRNKAETNAKYYSCCVKVANGVGFYSMHDRNEFLETINDERFI